MKCHGTVRNVWDLNSLFEMPGKDWLGSSVAAVPGLCSEGQEEMLLLLRLGMAAPSWALQLSRREKPKSRSQGTARAQGRCFCSVQGEEVKKSHELKDLEYQRFMVQLYEFISFMLKKIKSLS